jgi:hypothetical protein
MAFALWAIHAYFIFVPKLKSATIDIAAIIADEIRHSAIHQDVSPLYRRFNIPSTFLAFV